MRVSWRSGPNTLLFAPTEASSRPLDGFRYCRISFRFTFGLTTPLSGEGGSRSAVARTVIAS